MNFINWYRKIIENAGPEPPEKVWEEIRTELDLDRVWNGIERELPVSGKRRFMYVMAAAASLFIVIGVGTLLYLNFMDSGPTRFMVHREFQIDMIEDFRTDTSIITGLAQAMQFPAARQIEDVEIGKGEGEYRTSAQEQIDPIASVEVFPIANKTDAALKSVNTTLNGEEQQQVRKSSISSRYYAGLTGHAANTWLLNNKTIQGLRSDELTHSLPSFGYSIGIVAGKSITRNFDIQAEVHLISQTKQNYNEYLNGKYINNTMRFDYSGLSLSGKWYFTQKDFKGRHSILTGIYTGILRNAIQHLNGEKISISQDYNSTDYGIIGGYEYQYPIGNSLFVGTGLQTKYGLNNIFSGNEIVPDYLNSTRNASINITLSVRYNLN